MFNRLVAVFVLVLGFMMCVTAFTTGDGIAGIMWLLGTSVFLGFHSRMQQREALDDLDEIIEELEFDWQVLGENEPKAAREILLKARELYRAHARTAGNLRMKRLENLMLSCKQYIHQQVKER